MTSRSSMSAVAIAIAIVTAQPGAFERVRGTSRPVSPQSAVEKQDVVALLTQPLSLGEAYVWYLGHCGWAVKTRTRLLIFDYWGRSAAVAARTLANGWISPAEIRDLDVFVFVSHDHGDHYDPRILEWADSIDNITYVFGWDAALGPGFVDLGAERAVRGFGEMEVSTVNHRFDNIPEVAFLVKVDGLVLYHSGDHASISEVPNATFSSNIDYFASKQDHVDLAFVSTFGRRSGDVVNAGDLYTIETLKPRAVFPMHHGGEEHLNKQFADEVAEGAGDTKIVAARRRGDAFFYADKRIRSNR